MAFRDDTDESLEAIVKHEGKHRWAMSWPGNYCVCCGQDDIIEAAICCPHCIFDYPGPKDDWSIYVPKQPNLCAEHKALVEIKCPCQKEHEDGWRV